MTQNANILPAIPQAANVVPAYAEVPQIGSEEQAARYAEAAILDPETIRSAWGVNKLSSTPYEAYPQTFTIARQGARLSTRFMSDALEQNATCVVVETLTVGSDGRKQAAYYATDGSTTVALPPYDKTTGQFGAGTEQVHSWRVKEFPQVANDLVVGQSFTGQPGRRTIRTILLPDAAMAMNPVLGHIKSSGDEFVGSEGRRATLPLRAMTPANPVDSAYQFLLKAKARYGETPQPMRPVSYPE